MAGAGEAVGAVGAVVVLVEGAVAGSSEGRVVGLLGAGIPAGSSERKRYTIRPFFRS